jgi:hypothetical protein
MSRMGLCSRGSSPQPGVLTPGTAPNQRTRPRGGLEVLSERVAYEMELPGAKTPGLVFRHFSGRELRPVGT